MDFVAQESSKLIILMAAGAVFALAGLWLLLRPKPAAGAAKIELFGMKFESSSAGLLVFLMGAVFMVIPLFVPEKLGGMPQTDAVGASTAQPSGTAQDATGTAVAAIGSAAVVLPSGAQVEEVEPNDQVQQSNQLLMGQTVEGSVGDDEGADWFVVPIPVERPTHVEIQARHVGGYNFYVTLYDAREKRIDRLSGGNGATYLKYKLKDEDRLYLRVHRGTFDAQYQVTLNAATKD